MVHSVASEALIIFAKYPEPGKVKTRLAKSIGNEEACRWYTTLLSGLVKEHSNDQYDLIIAFTPPEKEIPFRKVLHAGRHIQFTPQYGQDLGERMHNALKKFLKLYQKVLIIGSDIPQVDRRCIDRAFYDLKDSDVVLGPCPDGGYYLIGMTRAHPVFEGIEWSTQTVLEAQLDRIREKNLSVALLEEKRDVDTLNDWEILRNDRSVKR